jgi:hypothetical protein
MEPSAVEQLQAEMRQLRPEIEAMRARILRLEETQGATQTRDRARGQPSADSQPIAEDFRVLDRDRSSPLPPLKFTQPARPSLESRIGSQLFNRIGIVALLVGAAWSLKYAADRHWLGAEARVSIGFAVGLALLAWSERFRRQQFPVFSFSLKAVGTGVLYLVLWASFALFHLVPYPVAFAGMVLVTAGNAWMCWVQRSEVLAAYAAIGGFLTPALLAQDHTSVLTLGSYLLLLNAGLLALLALRQWPRLLPAAFLGTTSYLVDLALHTARMHALGEAGEAFWLSAGFFALFSLAPVLLPSMDTSVAIPTAVSVTLANAAIGSSGAWGRMFSRRPSGFRLRSPSGSPGSCSQQSCLPAGRQISPGLRPGALMPCWRPGLGSFSCSLLAAFGQHFRAQALSWAGRLSPPACFYSRRVRVQAKPGASRSSSPWRQRHCSLPRLSRCYLTPSAMCCRPHRSPS